MEGSDPDATAAGNGAPLLRVEGVFKRYGGVFALRGASLRVGSAEVHGLAGENGSGKSTMLKILSGQVLPDRGTVTLDGMQLGSGDPVRSVAARIATVTQETTLVPDLSVAENILLGRKTMRRWYGVDWNATRRIAREVLERLELEIEPRAVARRLSPDQQQMVEIARAVSMDARLLILDEPTSSLTDDEVEALFGVVRALKDQGVSTIFVSHRMKEVFALVDRVTVLRGGVTVDDVPAAALDHARLIELMIGKGSELAEGDPELAGQRSRLAERESERSARLGRLADSVGQPRLRVRGLSVPGSVDDASLEVAPGEIVGLAGLVGAGRSELLSALFGLEPSASGTIELDGETIAPGKPMDAIANGLAYVPADRKRQGLVLGMGMRDNLLMVRSAAVSRLRRPNGRGERREVAQLAEDFRVRGVGSLDAPVANLSGGNQQKVVLAKWLGMEPKVLLLDEPTRGVDVGAKAEIYRLLEDFRSTRNAIVVSSSETPELLRLCDRVLVMFRGRIVATLTGSNATEARIAQYAAGHQ